MHHQKHRRGHCQTHHNTNTNCHRPHAAPYYEACQPGVTSLLGGMISVGNAVIWGGAHMVRSMVTDALWGNCSCGSSHHGKQSCSPNHVVYDHHCTPVHHEHHCC